MHLYTHHIIPTHFTGGVANNHPDNLIKLTLEEHAEAHKQLWLMERHNNDYIAYMALSGQISHEEASKKAQSRAGTTLSAEHKAKISAFQKGRPKSANAKANIGAAQRRSDVKAKIRDARGTYHHTPEARAKIKAYWTSRRAV